MERLLTPSRSLRTALALAAVLSAAAPAAASDDGFELWIEPSITTDLDENTGIELATSQRFRDAGDGRVDTYLFRVMLNQKLSDSVTVSAGVEQYVNDGGADETRALQQVTTQHGILRTRLRLEERFVSGSGRTGLRVRPRAGVSVPFVEDGPTSGFADVEGFFTVKSTSLGGDDGLTGVRTRIGISHEISDRFTASLAYLRQQDIRDGAPDRIGHVPLIGLNFKF